VREEACVSVQGQTEYQSAVMGELKETLSSVERCTPGFTSDLVEHIIRCMASSMLSERDIQLSLQRLTRYMER
jgi:hypothetical protein